LIVRINYGFIKAVALGFIFLCIPPLATLLVPVEFNEKSMHALSFSLMIPLFIVMLGNEFIRRIKAGSKRIMALMLASAFTLVAWVSALFSINCSLGGGCI